MSSISPFSEKFKLGILGGGQLGKMFIQSAVDLNLDIYSIDPDAAAPCASLAKDFKQGAITDYETVYQWGKDKNLITIEIENVNTEALKKLEKEGVQVFPQPHIIELIQDKRKQKLFYQENNIPTAPFILTDNKDAVLKNKSFLPAFQKLGKAGYDGRGVMKLETEKDLEKAFEEPSLLEKKIDFEKELSVIVARNKNGEIKTFPVVEMVFHPVHHLVEYLFAPAQISVDIEKQAAKLAESVIQKLDMVGILAVEMFLDKSGQVLVNEIAPRPHNSGHQTIEANITSQYEQHIRAILNLPLGDTEQIVPAAMLNLLGEDKFSGPAKYEGMENALAQKGVFIHLYGKKTTKPFRKMGHITILEKNIELLKEKTMLVKNMIRIISE